MKKSEFDFKEPQRQSYVAIVQILFKTIYVVFRQLIPIVFVVLLGNSSQKGDYIIYGVIAIAVLTMIYSVINFFKTYFVVQNGEFIFHTGVLNRKKIAIPLAKIQTINFEQNIIHQFFSVLKLKIDTAGSEKNEVELHALETPKAHALRDLILSEKSRWTKATLEDNNHNLQPSIPYKPIMTLGPTELIKIGLTENHIKSGALIFLFFFWVYQNLQEVGVDVDENIQDLPEFEANFWWLIPGFVLLMMISVAISLFRAFIAHFDLRFLRSSQGFKISSGLFTKKEVSAVDHKIQHISWSDNLLKKLIHYKDLTLHQASSAQINEKQKIKIPACQQAQIQSVVNTLFGQTALESFEMAPIHRSFFWRYTMIITLLFIVVSAAVFLWSDVGKWVYLCMIYVYLIVTRYLSYRKKFFGFNQSLLYVRGGIFGDKDEVLPLYKIQAVEKHQTPYQAKHQLCSLSIFTAAGGIKIPYIPLSTGHLLMDIFLYKVEVDTRKWM